MAQSPFEALVSGIKTGREIGTEVAQSNILQQVYAGQDVSTLTPEQQVGDFKKAAALAGQKGLGSLAYSFQKQANEIQSSNTENQLNQIKARQANLGLVGQLVQGASDEQGLTDAVNSVEGLATNEKQILMGIVKNPNIPFEQKQAQFQKLARTEEQNLRAQSLLGSAEERQDRMDARDERLLSTRIQNKIRTGAELTPEEQNYFDYGVTPWDSKRAAARGSVATGTAPAGKTEAPVSVRQNNPLNLTDSSGKIRTFDTPEEGAAAGKKDLEGKLSGASPAYKAKFGDKPVTPERLAETWSPAAAQGNTAESTANYAKAIAKAAGVEIGQPIPNTPEVRDKVFKAMADFEAGAYKPTVAKEPVAEDKLMKQYDEKRGGGLTIKEWDTINPTAVQIGKEYKVKPTNLASATTDEKKAADSAYQVTKLAEKNAEFIKEHPEAVGTLAAIFKSAAGKTGNLADNVSADKRYSGAVAELGKRLFALGLKDAAASAGGRMNVYLEKSFASLYDQSQSDRTLLRIIKARQDEAFDVLNNTYGADKENLNKDQYKLAFAPDADTYVGKGKKATADKPTADINSFFFNNQKNQ
jgi:hypothetical protein